jgi:hypothetical protein
VALMPPLPSRARPAPRVARAGILALAMALSGCPSAPPLPGMPAASARAASQRPPLPACGTAKCTGAQSLMAAMSAYGNVRHDFLLDSASSLSPGRGLERHADGTYTPVPAACARPKQAPAPKAAAGERPLVSGKAPAAAGAREIDFRYVGVAVDSVLVGGDVDLAGYFGAGGSIDKRRVRLVAMALVSDDDPQFFEATEDVTPAASGGACGCGRATHFVGAVKRGAMVSYELDVTAGEAHGSALSFIKARLEKGDQAVTMTTVGGLRLSGLDLAAAKPTVAAGPAELRFEVTQAVPIAYAVYPVADVCRFALPEPEIAPLPLDLGVVPYGSAASRPVHIVNRAAVDVKVVAAGREVDVPAFGSIELPLVWSPDGNTVGCERRTKEEPIVVRARDPRAPVTPRERTVLVPLQVTTGMPTFSKHEPVATERARAPDYNKASVDWTCPAGYVVEQCETQLARCLSPSHSCMSDGYRLTADENGQLGCRFRCTGPKSTLWGDNGCEYTAAMTCALWCR